MVQVAGLRSAPDYGGLVSERDEFEFVFGIAYNHGPEALVSSGKSQLVDEGGE